MIPKPMRARRLSHKGRDEIVCSGVCRGRARSDGVSSSGRARRDSGGRSRVPAARSRSQSPRRCSESTTRCSHGGRSPKIDGVAADGIREPSKTDGSTRRAARAGSMSSARSRASALSSIRATGAVTNRVSRRNGACRRRRASSPRSSRAATRAVEAVVGERNASIRLSITAPRCPVCSAAAHRRSSAIDRGDRIDPFRLELREIGGRHRPSFSREMARMASAIAPRRNPPARAPRSGAASCEVGVSEDLAGERCPAAGRYVPVAPGSDSSLSVSVAQCAAITSDTGNPSSA